MARTIGRLSALAVGRLKNPGLYPDGGGLYLQLSALGGKSWVFRYKINGRTREMGLGPAHSITLTDARQKAAECRRMRVDRIDPIEARRSEEAKSRLEAAGAISFHDCARAYIEAHRPGWKNAKHAAQWTATLNTYAEPIIGNLPIAAVNTAMMRRILDPIWTVKPETAGRVRGRLERIIDWATVQGYRNGENPARWKGHLDILLPKGGKVRQVQHHPAMPYGEVAALMMALREQDGVAADALQFTILTAARTGEVIGAMWDEINFDDALWIVPASRMKGRRVHRVPLSVPALNILKRRKALSVTEFIFPGAKRRRPLSNMAMAKVLDRLGYCDATVHGFRSSFRDWASERTSYRWEVAEAALGHAIGNKVEAAYRRGDLLEKRRPMMNDWAAWCGSPAKADGKVQLVRAGDAIGA